MYTLYYTQEIIISGIELHHLSCKFCIRSLVHVLNTAE